MTNPTAPRTLAVFDFDGTLNKGDSLLPFLVALCGWPKTLLALTRALIACAQQKPADCRTAIKTMLLVQLLKGHRLTELAPVIDKLKKWMTELPTAQVLRDHHAKGHHVVIASGSLSLYLPFLLDKLPHDALICTDVGIDDMTITGIMTNGNCVRARKAELLRAYIEKEGGFEDSWGYGNLPHDLPMLDEVKNRIAV